MNPLRFSIYAGVLWAGATLLLIVISLAGGDQSSWVELDFRPLTGACMLAADFLGHGSAFDSLVKFAENGMPITLLNVIISFLMGFADGFLSGLLISVSYNVIEGKKGGAGLSPLSFGLSFGAVFGLCSGILSAVVLLYDINIKSFDFSVKPLFLVFTNFEELFRNDFLYSARESYLYFPKSVQGVFSWVFWGFLDGFAGGAAGAYIYNKISGYKN